MDAILDLEETAHFNKPNKYNLSAIEPSILFVPEWCGHDFYPLRIQKCTMTSHAYDPTHDRGILWSSINFN